MIADHLDVVGMIRASPSRSARDPRLSGRAPAASYQGEGRSALRFWLNGMTSGMIDDIVPSTVTAIEVYPGMVAPPRYGGRGCAIAIWTGVRQWNDD